MHISLRGGEPWGGKDTLQARAMWTSAQAGVLSYQKASRNLHVLGKAFRWHANQRMSTHV
eukprot:6464794-Amphidinium_carterae.1